MLNFPKTPDEWIFIAKEFVEHRKQALSKGSFPAAFYEKTGRTCAAVDKFELALARP